MELEVFGVMDNAEGINLAKKIPELIKQGWSTHRNFAFQPGAVVWAQLQGYPSWPAIVEKDPDCDVFYDRSGSNIQYHVTFLDTVVSRAWIRLENLRPFTVKDGLPLLPKNQSRYRANLKKAFENAKRALSMPLNERLKTFNFTQCHVSRSVDKNDTTFVKITCSIDETIPDSCQLKVLPSINTSLSSQLEEIAEGKMPAMSVAPKRIIEENENESADEKQTLGKSDSVPKKFKKERMENEKKNGLAGKIAKHEIKKKIEEVRVETKKEKEMKEEVSNEEESKEEIEVGKKYKKITDRRNEGWNEKDEWKNVVSTKKINYELYKMGCCYSKLQ